MSAFQPARSPGNRLRSKVRRGLRRIWYRVAGYPAVGGVDFGDLRRLEPLNRRFGFGRGLPVDRYYIEGFLTRRAGDIQGRVLEIGDDAYTRRFGAERVAQRDVLHVVEGNPAATFVGDLTTVDHIPSDAFDCVILTQTLHLIYDMHAAVATLHRILKPGGVCLATVPGVTQIDPGEWGGAWCWSLTERSARLLFEELFPRSSVDVEVHGNVLAAVAFLHGVAAGELDPAELDFFDAQFPVLIGVRAVKPAGSPS